MDAISWCEQNAYENEKKMVSLQSVQNMLTALDSDTEVVVTEVVCWHPANKYIRLSEECLLDDTTKAIEIHFANIDVIEMMHKALGNILKVHYETKLEKLK
jgi:hypothetical protein